MSMGFDSFGIDLSCFYCAAQFPDTKTRKYLIAVALNCQNIIKMITKSLAKVLIKVSCELLQNDKMICLA